MKDKNGRAYATFADLKPGDRVEVDGDFTCIPAGAVRVVRENMSIECDAGDHHLCGQLDDTNTFYVGLYPVPSDG